MEPEKKHDEQIAEPSKKEVLESYNEYLNLKDTRSTIIESDSFEVFLSNL